MVNFFYDPLRDGYATSSFVTLGGTPAISTSYLRFNAASAIHVGNMHKCDLMVDAIIPAVPTTGDVRFIGLSNLGLGAKIGFDITDDVLSVVISSNSGVTDSQVIDFDPDWAGRVTSYQIRWNGVEAVFIVNGVQVYKFTGEAVPTSSLGLYIDNENSDAMDISGIDFRDIDTYK